VTTKLSLSTFRLGCPFNLTGFHADNNQGEKVILTVIAASPDEPRRVAIKTDTQQSLTQHNDIKINLYLDTGDAYVMDGEMQKNYLHALPKDKQVVTTTGTKEKKCRVALVFRHGDMRAVPEDNGNPATHLNPKPPSHPVRFGHINNVHEGFLYKKNSVHTWCSQVSKVKSQTTSLPTHYALLCSPIRFCCSLPPTDTCRRGLAAT